MPDFEEGDHEIGLADAQHLNELRYELITCNKVLDSNISIAQGVRKHCAQCRSRGQILRDMNISTKFEVILAKFESHKGTCTALLAHLNGTMDLVWLTLLPRGFTELILFL